MAVIGTFTDPRDGEVYKTCKIGDQIWMAENLRFRTKNGGSYAYDNDESNEKKYGRLYTWKAAKEACPPGWFLPTSEEWEELASFVEAQKYYMSSSLRGKEYTVRMVLGAEEWWGGWDTFGFSALPAGSRDSSGDYYGIGDLTIFWSSTKAGDNEVFRFHLPMEDEDSRVIPKSTLGKNANSIRCISEQTLIKKEQEKRESLEQKDKEQNKGRLINIFIGILFTLLSIVAYCYLLPDNSTGLTLGLISGIGVIICATLDNYYEFLSDFAAAIAAGGILGPACLAFLANIFFTETFSILSVILTVVPLLCVSLSHCECRKSCRRRELDKLRQMELRRLGGKIS